MRVAFIAATAALGGLLFGYDTGVISGALLFLRQAFQLSDLMLGVVTSLALAGAALGAGLAGPLSDRHGRRQILIATAWVFVVGGLVSACASSLPVLLAGRLIVGLGIGGASMLTPLYLAEIAPARERGALVSLNQLAVTVGILVAYIVGYAFAAAGAWRWMLGLGATPGLLLAGGMLLLPESPRWLAGHGHLDQARAALLRLRGAQSDIEPEMAQLRADLHPEAKALPTSRLGHSTARLPLIVGIGLALFQQVTGINTVIYFAPVIFQSSGLSSASAAILATAGIGIVNVVMTILAIWLVDRIGRRPLLLSGLLGMGVSLCLLASAFLLGHGWLLSLLTGGSLAAYVGFFAIGMGPVFWLLISELFPLAIRAKGMSAATIANWLANLAVALTFLSTTEMLGRPSVFFLYAGFTFAAFTFAYWLVPETKGLSLEEIEALWLDRTGAKTSAPRGGVSRNGSAAIQRQVASATLSAPKDPQR